MNYLLNFLFILLISSGLGQSLFAQNTVNPLPFSVAQLEQDLRSLKEFVSLLNQVLKNHDQASLNKEQLSILNVLSNKDLTKNIRLNSNSEKFKSRRKDINKLLNDTINSLKKYPLSTIYSGKLEKNLEEISFRIHNLLENYPSQLKALLLPMGFDKPVKMESLIQNNFEENSARKHYANHQKNRTERRAIFSNSFIQALLELTSSATALLYANNQNEILSGIIGFITLAIVVKNIPKILNGIKLLRALPKNNVDAIIRANRTAEEERKRINKHIQKINKLIRENITKSCQASARRITRN